MNAKNTSNTTVTKISGDCSSVLIQVSNNESVYSYRRDDGDTAELIINKETWNGKRGIKEFKDDDFLGNLSELLIQLIKGDLKLEEYFTHTIITEDGWYIGIGGASDGNTNKQLESYCKQIILNGTITENNKLTIQKYIQKNNKGHCVIKDQYGNGYAYMHYFGENRSVNFKLKPGDSLTIPNDPKYFKRGHYKKYSSNPVNAGIFIAATDEYGIPRRNIITYNVQVNQKQTNIKIYASRDTGKLLGRTDHGGPDPIKLFGNNKENFKPAPGKTYLGEVKYKR